MELPTATGEPPPKGAVLVGILVLLGVLGFGMAATSTVWQTVAVREKEAELLFVGDQFRRAIESYREGPFGGVPQLPKSLEELLLDPRFPGIRRHLRKLYRDPITGQTEWGLIRDVDGGILGVYSLSEAQPMKTAGFPTPYQSFTGAERYQDWQFQAELRPSQ
jgi:type II secretory pathway pseudopilin PulG